MVSLAARLATACAIALLVAWLPPSSDFESARGTLDAADIQRDLQVLAAPSLEGRDTPSVGLDLAADHIAARFEKAGLEPLGEKGSYRLPFERRMLAPDPTTCRLVVTSESETAEIDLGEGFVPLPRCSGSGDGKVIFLGYGISAPEEGYDDLAKVRLSGRIVVILEGEPEHETRFDGPAISSASNVYAKVEALEDRDAEGIVIVRRRGTLGYRYTWASWNGKTTEPLPAIPRKVGIPVVEVDAATAQRMFGFDPAQLAQEIERTDRPVQRSMEDVRVRMTTKFRAKSVRADNVAGVVRGTDPRVADEFLVIGAHYDHVGVDVLGRIGYGADDNATGTAAVLEIAEAFAAAPAARPVIVVAFAGEEDGLLGSRAFLRNSPVPRKHLMAMLNLDMIGRGDPSLSVVLGTRQNPGFLRLLERATKLSPTGIDQVVVDRAQHLWQRSDHYPFHQAGLPVLFFFEARSEDENADYHTYRDTLDLISVEKVKNTTSLAFNCAWLLANDQERPAPPRR